MSTAIDERCTIRQRLNSMIAPESITEIPDDATVEVRGEDGITYGNISYADFASKVGDCVHSNLSTLDTVTAAFTTTQKTKLAMYPDNVLTITGTTGALGADTGYDMSGVTKSQVVGFMVMVSDSGGMLRLPNHGTEGSSTYSYTTSIGATDGDLWIYIPPASTDVYSCSFTAQIFYTD